LAVEDVLIPDIGGATDVDVIEVMVKPGDTVAAEDALITLEGDKATMDIPAPFAGVIKDVTVTVGDKVSEGSKIMTITVAAEDAAKQTAPAAKAAPPPQAAAAKPAPTPAPAADVAPPTEAVAGGAVHAGPAVRRIAREFGVDLTRVVPTGPKGRIVKLDVQAFVKAALAKAQVGAGGISVAAAPKIDFSKFGSVDIKPLNKIKRLTGVNVHRSWVTIPHVTQFDEADITEMEAFRQEHKAEAEKRGFKLTPLVFVMRAVVECLKALPQFNSSLDDTGQNLVMKQYFHIGIAADTPNGLVVPVIRDVDKKSLFELAEELGKISAKAREKGLSIQDMAGSCFTISSLGGIGGTAFTPIVKSPDVAILGVSRAQMKPLYRDGEFVPRLMLPLSLSYDHRVIDGADGARFTTQLVRDLTDVRTWLL